MDIPRQRNVLQYLVKNRETGTSGRWVITRKNIGTVRRYILKVMPWASRVLT